VPRDGHDTPTARRPDTPELQLLQQLRCIQDPCPSLLPATQPTGHLPALESLRWNAR
jgi:hypothetical protein